MDTYLLTPTFLPSFNHLSIVQFCSPPLYNHLLTHLFSFLTHHIPSTRDAPSSTPRCMPRSSPLLPIPPPHPSTTARSRPQTQEDTRPVWMGVLQKGLLQRAGRPHCPCRRRRGQVGARAVVKLAGGTAQGKRRAWPRRSHSNNAVKTPAGSP